MEAITYQLESTFRQRKGHQHEIVKDNIRSLHKKLIGGVSFSDGTLDSCWQELKELPFGNQQAINHTLSRFNSYMQDPGKDLNDDVLHTILYLTMLLSESATEQILIKLDESKLSIVTFFLLY